MQAKPHEISTATIVRFGIRLPLMAVCATFAQAGFASSLAVILLLCSALCVILGLLRQERALGGTLNNWDEAAAYACLAALALRFDD